MRSLSLRVYSPALRFSFSAAIASWSISRLRYHQPTARTESTRLTAGTQLRRTNAGRSSRVKEKVAKAEHGASRRVAVPPAVGRRLVVEWVYRLSAGILEQRGAAK